MMHPPSDSSKHRQPHTHGQCHTLAQCHEHPQHRRGWRRVLGIVAAMFGLMLASVVTPALSLADTPITGHWVKSSGVQGSQGFWLGPNSRTMPDHWCVDMWSPMPAHAEIVTQMLLAETQSYGPAELTLTLKELAWVMTSFKDDQSDDKQAAIAYLVHVNLEQPSANPSHPNPEKNVAQLINAVKTELPQVDEQARDLVKQARLLTPEGGSYSVLKKSVGAKYQAVVYAQFTPPADPPQFQPQATSSVGQAHLVDDQTLHDTIVVDADPTEEWPLIDGVAVPVQFEGTVYALGETPDIAAEAGVQMAQQSDSVADKPADSATGDEFADQLANQLANASTNGSRNILAGADTGVSGETPAEVPTDAIAVGTVILTVEGPGTYEAQLSGVEPGFYTWVWSVHREQQTHEVIYDGAHVSVADMIKADWSDGYALPEETSSVRSAVTVRTEAALVDKDGVLVLTDSIWASGFPEDHPNFTGSRGFDSDQPVMTSTLLFFPEGLDVLEENRNQAQVVGHLDVPAQNGQWSTGDHFNVLEGNPAGTYVFVTSFAGDDRVAPLITSVEDAAEQVLVSAPEVTPVQNLDATPETKTAGLAHTGLPGKTLGTAAVLLLLAGGGVLALNRYRKL